MINFKFAKASNLEGRILYQIMVSILFKKLTFAFNNEGNLINMIYRNEFK